MAQWDPVQYGDPATAPWPVPTFVLVHTQPGLLPALLGDPLPRAEVSLVQAL